MRVLGQGGPEPGKKASQRPALPAGVETKQRLGSHDCVHTRCCCMLSVWATPGPGPGQGAGRWKGVRTEPAAPCGKLWVGAHSESQAGRAGRAGTCGGASGRCCPVRPSGARCTGVEEGGPPCGSARHPRQAACHADPRSAKRSTHAMDTRWESADDWVRHHEHALAGRGRDGCQHGQGCTCIVVKTRGRPGWRPCHHCRPHAAAVSRATHTDTRGPWVTSAAAWQQQRRWAVACRAPGASQAADHGCCAGACAPQVLQLTPL
jgi:hypothetical protein